MVLHLKQNSSTDAQQLSCIALGSRYTLGPDLRAQHTPHRTRRCMFTKHVLNVLNRHVSTCLLGSVMAHTAVTQQIHSINQTHAAEQDNTEACHMLGTACKVVLKRVCPDTVAA